MSRYNTERSNRYTGQNYYEPSKNELPDESYDDPFNNWNKNDPNDMKFEEIDWDNDDPIEMVIKSKHPKMREHKEHKEYISTSEMLVSGVEKTAEVAAGAFQVISVIALLIIGSPIVGIIGYMILSIFGMGFGEITIGNMFIQGLMWCSLFGMFSMIGETADENKQTRAKEKFKVDYFNNKIIENMVNGVVQTDEELEDEINNHLHNIYNKRK